MIPRISLNRILHIGMCVAGFGAILVSLKAEWFSVPLAPPGGARSPSDIALSIPACTDYSQAAIAILVIIFTATWLWRRKGTMASSMLASLMLLVPLLYPYFVVVRSPEISADASWLQMQHNNLTWLGGDIYANAEYGSKGWRAKTYLIDPPRQLSVINLPSWSPWETGLHRSEDFLLWLGYSNTFCQFVGKGWGLAIFGSLLLFLVSLQDSGALTFRRAGAALALFSIAGFVAAILGWTLPFMASIHLREAAELCSRQEYKKASDHLEDAADLLPVLRHDTFYVAQRGVLDQRMNVDSDYKRLRRAVSLESVGRYDQAMATLKELIDSDVSSIRRESLRAILRFAIQDYNCARFELSSERFSLVLKHTPCDVKLIYLLQVQAIREARVERVSEMRDWMYEASGYFNFGTKKILRAVSQQNVATAVGLNGSASEIWDAQRKAKKP